MYRTFQRDSAISNLLKWNLFQTYMPWFLTLTGCKYLNFTLLDAFSYSLPILSSSKKFVPPRLSSRTAPKLSDKRKNNASSFFFDYLPRVCIRPNPFDF